MRLPPSPLQLVLFVFLLVLLFTLVQIGLLHLAAEKLGIDFSKAIIALLISLGGSFINIPLFTLPSPPTTPTPFHGWLLGGATPSPDRVIVAINLGGAIMPLLFSFYLFNRLGIGVLPIILATLAVSSISYLLSRPIPGMGIGIPVFIPPMVAAVSAFIFAPEQQAAAVAYIGGTLGVIIGADILRLKEVKSIGASVASIGGAGTFDGIFLTGIVAVLLA